MEKRCCAACAFSGIDMDAPTLICQHPDAGMFGLYLYREPSPHCPDYVKFEQHPGRNPDGTLKKLGTTPDAHNP